ncbi:MAG: indole-3-glycerol phosphate synthase TrpC [Acidobacteria bacterium]|nr:MAG: indole-3-glycerol phosphate synthase TrpC [Acidobacteriota bacterium]
MVYPQCLESAGANCVSIAETKPGTILSRIIESRRAEVARRQRIMPETVLRIAAGKADAPRDFAGALARDNVNVIAEIKKASPSAGVLRREFEPAALARAFEQAGAAALSVLTEEENFQGVLAHLRDARAAVALPVLRKDFMVDRWQVWEARAANADSFLLIAAALHDTALTELLALGRELGMEAVVEVHTAEELERVLAMGARIIGVNNRNLHTLEVRLETSLELVEMIPDDRIAVSESGLRSAEDLRQLRAAGFDAFLIGESLMREALPGAALGRLIDAVSAGSSASGAGSSDRSR